MRNFIGHKTVISNFKKRIELGEISHAHIIVGEDGIGKSNLSKILAENILGKDESKSYIDIINYKCKKTSIGIDDVREIVSEVNKKPFEGDKKVIIIYSGNKMTVQAQNALLKTIEEPPSGIYIMLLCESLEFVLDTIKSRCQIHKLTPLTKEEIQLYVHNILEGDYNQDEIKAAISYSGGIPGKVETFLMDSSLKELRDLLINLLYVIISGNIKNILDFEEKILSYKNEKEEVINVLSSFIRDIMIYKELDDVDEIINGDKIEDIKKLAIEMSYKKLNKIIDNIGEARRVLLSNSNFQLTIRVMLIGFMEV